MFSHGTGLIIAELTDVTQDSTVDVNLPEEAEGMLAQVYNSSGKMVPPDDAVFTIVLTKKSTEVATGTVIPGKVTYTNKATSAFTGELVIVTVAN